VVLLAVAILLGIVILNKTEEGVSTSSQVRTTTPSTSRSGQGSTTLAPPTTGRPVRPAADVKVLPANGSGVGGIGGKVGDRLRAKGYTNTLAATNTTRQVPATSIEYANDFEPEAQALAVALGLPPTVAKALDSPPVPDTKGADVVVLIGPDLAAASSSTTAPAGAGTTTSTRR
jgi:hypothetical protein